MYIHYIYIYVYMFKSIGWNRFQSERSLASVPGGVRETSRSRGERTGSCGQEIELMAMAGRMAQSIEL